MAYLATIRKALAAAVLAAAAVLVSAQQSGVEINQTIWISALIAAVIAGGGVFLIPNKPATA